LLEYGEDGEERLKMCLFTASSVLESNALLAPKAGCSLSYGAMRVK
jgi:hypothetical protein